MFDIILRGGTVVTPHGVAVQDVVVKGELIEAITNPNAIASEKAKSALILQEKSLSLVGLIHTSIVSGICLCQMVVRHIQAARGC